MDAPDGTADPPLPATAVAHEVVEYSGRRGRGILGVGEKVKSRSIRSFFQQPAAAAEEQFVAGAATTGAAEEVETATADAAAAAAVAPTEAAGVDEVPEVEIVEVVAAGGQKRKAGANQGKRPSGVVNPFHWVAALLQSSSSAAAARAAAAGEPGPSTGGPRGSYRKWTEQERQLALDIAVKMRDKNSKFTTRQIHNALLDLPPFEQLAVTTLDAWLKKGTAKNTHGGRVSVFADKQELLESIKVYVKNMAAKAPVNISTLAVLIKEHILEKGQAAMLEGHGGSFKVSMGWVWGLLHDMGLSSRAGTTASQKLPDNWEELGDQLVHQCAYMVWSRGIPPELVINADQSGLAIVQTGKRTWAAKGAKEVPMPGQDDKRQITLMGAVSAANDILPPQVIFQGTTQRSLPSGEGSKQLRELGSHQDCLVEKRNLVIFNVLGKRS